MQYRPLGKTGLDVSVIGMGCAQLGSPETDYAVRLVHEALNYGINYFDTARGYWDSEIKLGQALKGQRDSIYISTKTGGHTKEEAWRNIRESLERLQTGYLDNVHLHGVDDQADLDKRTGPGGALEALIEAREQGIVRHIGCTGHNSRTLLMALERFDFEVILVPMNFVEREPLDKLIPRCQERGVGVTIMKPMGAGLMTSTLGLKWLVNQPIACAVPGMSTLEEVRADALVGHGADLRLTPNEQQQVAEMTAQFAQERCRICGACEPCPTGLSVQFTLGSDLIYMQYQDMGREAFRAFPWSRQRLQEHLAGHRKTLDLIRACTDCGVCEERCPHGLPVRQLLRKRIEPMEDMLRIWEEWGIA